MKYLIQLALCCALIGLCAPVAPAQDAPDQAISADPTEPTDTEIEDRLRGIYLEVDGLESVTVESEVGVVTLRGTVLQDPLSDEAERLAEAMNGVVTVQNEIRRDSRFLPQVKPVVSKITSFGGDLLQRAPLLLFALFILLLFWWLGGWLSRSISLPSAWTPNLFVDELVRLLVRFLIGLVGILLAAELLGATALLVSVLGGLGVLGLALGFAIRDTVENFVASVLLSLRQPFGANEHVSIDGHEGRVVRLTSRATILLDMNGNHVRLPNSMVYKSTMVNYSRNAKRRFQFDVGVDTDVGPSVAQQLAVKTLEDLEGVLGEPPPQCVVHALGDSNVVLRVYGWVDQREADFTKTRSASMAAVKQAFESAEINMPEPIYRLRVENVDSKVSKSATITEIPAPDPVIANDLKPDTAITDQVREHRDGDDLLNVNAPRE